MGKRQQRITFPHATFTWKDQVGKEMSVVCRNGAVYFGMLNKVSDREVKVKDSLGRIITLAITDIKELILDFVTEH